MQRWRSWCSSALLLVALPAVVNAQIYSVQHEPREVALDLGPEQLAILSVNRGGPQSDTAIKYQSQFIYIGCFWAPQSITMDSEQDTSFDPAECVDVCKTKPPIVPSGHIVAAVQGKRCGCVKPPQTEDDPEKLMQIFEVSDQPKVDCQTACKYYDNELCGGDQDNGYWGVFKEYDYQSMSSQGAYDPWRYIWYTVVVMLERTIDPSIRVDGYPVQDDDTPIPPERYYLSAIDQQSGRPKFEFQCRLPGIVQGLQFDLDSNRLVGLLIDQELGRVRFGIQWTYKLMTIFINTTTPTYPNMTFENDYPLINLEEDLEKEIFLYTGASAIVSRNDWDVYVFVLIQDQISLKQSRNNIYFVKIPTGEVLRSNPLDFRVVQLFSNEKYGDVSVAAIRYQQTVWLYIARVEFNELIQRTEIRYSYQASRPEFLVDPPEPTASMWLMPGASCSEHLYNKSYSLIRNISNDHDDPRYRNETGILMLEILMRAKTYDFFCDKETGCLNSMNTTIPYAAIFNREPRIPLSLKSPELILAKFNMEATYISAYFDQNTLKGALPVDTNNDIVPDDIDYNTQLTGQWDCARIFDADTVLLIGPAIDGTYCEWLTDQEIRITLPRDENYPPVDIGDQLFLRADTIYTAPRDGEYSAAGQGGIEVSLPDPISAPTIRLSGANTVDECTPVEFNAQDTMNVGGAPIYNWSLSEHPIDLTNNPAGRIWDNDKIAYVYEALDNATKDNAAVLSLDTSQLSPAAKYMIKLTVFSRWGLNSSETVELTRLDFPSPLVDISPATQEIIRNRTDEVVLTAIGTPSLCVGVTRELGYRWTETTGKLDLPQIPDLTYTTKTLILPPMTMEPEGVVGEYNVYNFTVECYVAQQPNRFATDWIVVKIQRSPVYAYLSMEDRLLTRGKDLVLDARESQDVDYPTDPGSTFKGVFSWWCFGPGNPPTPCFPNLDGFFVGTTTSPETEYPTCSTDVWNKFLFAGHQFSTPVWSASAPGYCKWARGVLMATTRNFSIDNYTWTVEARASDGRANNKTVVITITEYEVPVMFLAIQDPKTKYATTGTIRINGQIESEFDPAANPTFSWTVWRWAPNPAYDLDAAQTAQSTGDVYPIDPEIWQDESDTLNLTNPLDPQLFSVREDTPNLIIYPNALVWESTQYKVRLTVSMFDGAVTSFSDISFETAGGPPRPGKLLCDPMNGTIQTERILAAPDWVADDLPLVYRFGYMKDTASLTVKVPFSTEAIPVSSITQTLPLGEQSSNYTLTLYVDVLTPFAAISEMFLQVQSKPPANVSDMTAALIAKMQAPGADPEETLEDAQTVLEIQQFPEPEPGQAVPTVPPTADNVQLMDTVLDILDTATDSVPVTVATTQQTVSVLKNIVDSSGAAQPTTPETQALATKTMDSIEKVVTSGANAGLFSPENYNTALQTMDLISAMYSDCESPQACIGGLSGGRRLAGRRLRSGTRVTAAEKRRSREDQDHLASTALPRREQNHPAPRHEGEVLHNCTTAYCDFVFLKCVRKQRQVVVKDFKSEQLELADLFPRTMIHTCCDDVNPRTMCNQPPCWFRGNKCPMQPTVNVTPQSSSDELERRLQARPEKTASTDWAWQWSEELGYRSLHSHKSTAVAKSAKPAILNSSGYTNTTEVLEEIYRRRLQASTPLVGNRGVESEERIMFLEALEEPILRDVRADLAARNREAEQVVRADARLELLYAEMNNIEAEKAKKEAADLKNLQVESIREIERSFSQIITRTGVLRDTICKQIIVQMTTSVEVLRFDTNAFTLWIGKTRNMTSVRPSMIFPDKFIVPPNTGDEPTADNPLTAFAFIYIEYKKNIYGWSDSAPPGNESNLMTIVVMKASTTEIEVKNETDPIRVFADESLYSSALCMFWDRFAPNTAGGAWSPRGLLNDGEGCLTTHLSDLGLFVDGRVPTSILVDKAVSYYLEDTVDGPEGSKYNMATVVVVGFSIFLGTTLALAGYIQDELIRERERAGKAPHTHWLGGNGVTSAINVDDCIAYDHVGTRHWFLVVTLWKVILRDHAVLGLAKYHHAFTRPQRILCLGVMATSILAVNAMIYGVPKELVSGDQFVPSGVISGLVSFPLFVACIFMFASRPTLLKKRLIKRATDTSIVDSMRKEREKIEHESAKLYPKSYPALHALPMPPGMMAPQGFSGGPALLALPAAVPLWPNMPAVPPPPGMALPPPPPPSMLPLTQGAPLGMMPIAGMRGAAGLPSLPPLPPLKNNFQALPPPPKYNPPSATLSRPGLPPPGRGLASLPSHSAEQSRQMNMAVTDGDTRTPPEPRTPPDTGRQEFPPLPAPSTPPMASTPPMPSTPPGGPSDQQLTSTLPGSFAPEGIHRMEPVLEADTEVAEVSAERELQDETQHGMMMHGTGAPPPPPPGPPPDDDYHMEGFATPRTPQSRAPSDYGSWQNPPPPITTPPSGPGFHGMVTGGISASGIVYRGEAPSLIPAPSYAPGLGTQPPRHPPEPPNFLRLPQMPGLPKMQSMQPPPGFGLPKGVPGPLVPGKGGLGLPPGVEGGPPAGMPPGFMTGAGLEQGRKPLPPPPPPPKEDDAVFVRRMRLVGLERSAKEADKRLVEHMQDPGKDIPSTIYLIMTLCPYIACMVSICAQVFITLAYSMKFQRIAETYWYYSTIIGLCEVLLVLEFMRSAVMMIVELRKFEIRRRLYGGAFNQSRVGRRTEGPNALQPNKKVARTPQVPTVAPKKPAVPPPPPPPKSIGLGPPPFEALSPPDDGSNPRPAFLPPLAGGSTLTPPGTAGGTALPSLPGGVSLPVGKAPPVGASPAHKMPSGMNPLDFSRGLPGLPGMNTPPRGRPSNSLGTAGGQSLLPGALRSSNTPPSGFGTPKIGQSFGSTTQGTVPAPPPVPSLKARPPSPSGSVASNMSKSLSEKMAASKLATPPGAPGVAKQPTPPGSQRGAAKPPSGTPSSQSLAQKRAAMRGQ